MSEADTQTLTNHWPKNDVINIASNLDPIQYVLPNIAFRKKQTEQYHDALDKHTDIHTTLFKKYIVVNSRKAQTEAEKQHKNKLWIIER